MSPDLKRKVDATRAARIAREGHFKADTEAQVCVHVSSQSFTRGRRNKVMSSGCQNFHFLPCLGIPFTLRLSISESSPGSPEIIIGLIADLFIVHRLRR